MNHLLQINNVTNICFLQLAELLGSRNISTRLKSLWSQLPFSTFRGSLNKVSSSSNYHMTVQVVLPSCSLSGVQWKAQLSRVLLSSWYNTFYSNVWKKNWVMRSNCIFMIDIWPIKFQVIYEENMENTSESVFLVTMFVSRYDSGFHERAKGNSDKLSPWKIPF